MKRIVGGIFLSSLSEGSFWARHWVYFNRPHLWSEIASLDESLLSPFYMPDALIEEFYNV